MSEQDSSLIESSLREALRIEEALLRNYRAWAMRFLPYDRGISREFYQLCGHLKQHKSGLLFCASRALNFNHRLKKALVAEKRPRLERQFIGDLQTATQVLDSAIEKLHEARSFYHAPPEHPLLHKTYEHLQTAHQQQILALENLRPRLHERRKKQRLALPRTALASLLY